VDCQSFNYLRRFLFVCLYGIKPPCFAVSKIARTQRRRRRRRALPLVILKGFLGGVGDTTFL
jgi:hypothetical protein